MEGSKAILDTSALLCLYHLDLLSGLNLLFSEVRVPRAVEREFLIKNPFEEERSRRLNFLMRFYSEQDSWFIPCSEYGSDLVAIYLSVPKMNEGEAEALAQNQFFDSTYTLILDETIARKNADKQHMQKRGTLALLAALALRFGTCSYFESVSRLQNELNTRFSEKVIQDVWEIEVSNVENGMRF